MGKPAAVSQSEIDKAVKVAVQHGLEVREIVIEPGRVRVLTGDYRRPSDDADLVNWSRPR